MEIKFQWHSLQLVFVLFLFLFMKIPLALSMETATFEKVFSEYKTKWEISEEISSAPPSEYGHPQETDIRVLVGSDYFGIYVPHKLYKHFNSNGKLMCTIELQGDYLWANISPTGNRIMLVEHQNEPRSERIRINVYNESGTHIFSTPYNNFDIISTDSGNYYFSQPNIEFGFPLHIFNNNGEQVQTDFESIGGWSAKPLDEKRLIYADRNEVMIVEIATNTVITERAISDFASEYWRSFNSVISPGGKTIALWSQIEIIIIDDNLDLLGRVVMEGAKETIAVPKRRGGQRMGRFSNISIEDVAFSQDGGHLLYVSQPSREKESKINIVSLAGEPISIIPTEYLPKQINLGKGYITTWSRSHKRNEEGFVEFRFFSEIFRIDKDSKELISRHIMKNRVYPFGKNGDFLELGDGFIRRWSMKGE
jgi:hypothetical protein